MKKTVFILLLLIGGVGGFYLGYLKIRAKPKEKISVQKTKPEVQGVEKVPIVSRSVFVPYWSLDQEKIDISGYDKIIYFGITASYNGINKSEQGYSNLRKFNSIIPEKKEKLLALRMINEDINDSVLSNIRIQEVLIRETLELLSEYEYDGLVLDLEISSLLNKEITSQINDFVQKFYTAVSADYRKLYLTVYGDNFYRGRPYDVEFLAKKSDGIMIMAYDLHKSRGEPGPNFPYDTGIKYQYDFKSMISDFLTKVPKEKITVIFGYFGYDWLVDEKKRPIRPAEALSFKEIKSKFLDKCEFKDCVSKRDKISQESEVNYVISAPVPDEQNIYRIDYHIVWFEDEESIKVKTSFLQEQGISSVSYWAYGYF